MSSKPSQRKCPRVDLPSMEADIAFFEARLSLANHAPDTVYQRAQIKVFRTLGDQVGELLSTLREQRKGQRPSKDAVA